MSECKKRTSAFSTNSVLIAYEPERSRVAKYGAPEALKRNNANARSRFISFYPPAVTQFLQLAVPLIKIIVSLPADELRPNPITNSLLMSLKNLIHEQNLKDDEISMVSSHSAIRRYHKILLEKCSLAEYFWEVNFAEEIISGNKLNKEKTYSFDDYESCVQFEMDTLKTYAKNFSFTKVAVIGSGPVPLTSVEVLKHLPPSGVVMNFDYSEEAVRLSKILVQRECKERLFVKQRSALNISAKDLDQVNVVYLAALVGTDKMVKENIVEHLYNVMPMGSILIARTAVGLNRLLYAELTPHEFGKFADVQEFRPKDKTLLSIICGRRKYSFQSICSLKHFFICIITT